MHRYAIADAPRNPVLETKSTKAKALSKCPSKLPGQGEAKAARHAPRELPPPLGEGWGGGLRWSRRRLVTLPCSLDPPSLGISLKLTPKSMQPTKTSGPRRAIRYTPARWRATEFQPHVDEPDRTHRGPPSRPPPEREGVQRAACLIRASQLGAGAQICTNESNIEALRLRLLGRAGVRAAGVTTAAVCRAW